MARLPLKILKEVGEGLGTILRGPVAHGGLAPPGQLQPLTHVSRSVRAAAQAGQAKTLDIADNISLRLKKRLMLKKPDGVLSSKEVSMIEDAAFALAQQKITLQTGTLRVRKPLPLLDAGRAHIQPADILEDVIRDARKSGILSPDTLRIWADTQLPAIRKMKSADAKKAVVNLIRREGFDSIVYINTIEGFGSASFVVLDPKQFQLKRVLKIPKEIVPGKPDVLKGLSPLIPGMEEKLRAAIELRRQNVRNLARKRLQ